MLGCHQARCIAFFPIPGSSAQVSLHASWRHAERARSHTSALSTVPGQTAERQPAAALGLPDSERMKRGKAGRVHHLPRAPPFPSSGTEVRRIWMAGHVRHRLLPETSAKLVGSCGFQLCSRAATDMFRSWCSHCHHRHVSVSLRMLLGTIQVLSDMR